ncbi:MAG: recombination mediator RecR [Rickettsiales bacterium]|jgi:recombination protein RecR|nr:recombination mediator RecR [Rickettsiales bacterium]
MSFTNPRIENLIKKFARLPRVGARAATRIVLSLLTDETGRASELAAAISDASQNIRPCPNCGCLTDGPCSLCADASRENGQLCIVRDLSDVWTIERAGVFRGRYHILGGLLSGANGVTPDSLRVENLPARIAAENIGEIIFALPNTVEGKTTMHYVINKVESEKRKAEIFFSELASGVPLGGDLDYIDDGTLSLAFGRRAKI